MSRGTKFFLLFTSLGACAVVIFAVFLRYRGDGMPCVFCDIVAKKADTQLVYEDEVSVELLRGKLDCREPST
jgi:hypothetical protein